jgi:hypothetical protein
VPAPAGGAAAVAELEVGQKVWTELGGQGRMTDTVQGPCVFCGRPTTDLWFAPGLGQEVPADGGCLLRLIVLERKWRRGALEAGTPRAELAQRLFGPVAPQLTEGV